MGQTQTSEIPLGEFPLSLCVANEEDIRRAYEEDDPIMIGFSGHHINDSYRVEAVFRLREDAGFKGHTLSPAGYNVRIFRKSEAPFVEITLRKGA